MAAPRASDELVERLRTLERAEQLDDSVRRPVALAHAALERARTRASAGDAASARRAEAIARAAVELAEARLLALRERSLLVAARARRALAEQTLEGATRALAREQARQRELERASVAP